jgi:hypothetical protein
MLGWLEGQLVSPHIETSNTIKNLAYQLYWKQSVRLFLEKRLKNYISLPWWATPQPVVVVFDHAECFLQKHRAEAVSFFHPLVKMANNGPHSEVIKLIVIVNSEKAVKSLQQTTSERFMIVDCPRVDMGKIEDGQLIKKTLEDCQGCIGYAMSYLRSEQLKNKKSAKEFSGESSKCFRNRDRLFQPILEAEYWITERILMERNIAAKENPPIGTTGKI